MGFVVIKRFKNYIEANIVKGMLEANDISCWLQSEYLSLRANGIKLLVNEDQLQQALDLIQNTQQPD